MLLFVYPSQAIAKGLKEVISSHQMADTGSTSSSVLLIKTFLLEHSIGAFCDQAWNLASFVVNKRMQEPRMFKVQTICIHNYVCLGTLGEMTTAVA